MQTIRKFFCQFDMFCAPAVLRIKEEPEMKSLPAGIVSFALGCFFAYVFISSSIDVINFTKIDSTQSDTIIKSNQTAGTFPMFAISLDWMEIQNFSQIFEFTTYVYSKGKYSRELPMRACRPEQWKQIGDNYESSFQQYWMGSMFCPDITQQMQLKETFLSNVPTFIWVTLTACNVNNTGCDPTNVAPYLSDRSSEPGDGAAVISIYVLDKAISPDQKDPVQYFINIDAKAQVTKRFGGVATIEFSSFQIQTDVSIWPVQQTQSVSGIQIGTVRNYQAGFDDVTTDVLARVLFTMNQNKAIVKRKVGKIDELLSYAGGLFSIVIGFLAFFLLSFNEYRYELMVAEGVFTLDQTGRKVKETQMGFLRYIKYTIFDWVQVLCCCQLPWQDCKEINETREEIISQMEVSRIFKRLRNLELAVKNSILEDQRLCLSLLEQPTLEGIKKERMEVDYFEAVVQGEPALTVKDVRMINNQLVSSMKILEPEGPSKIGDSFNDFEQNSFAMLDKSRKEDRVNMIRKIGESFPDIKKQAEMVQLDEDLDEAETKIALAFSRLPPQEIVTLQQKIPIIIMQRMWMKMQKMSISNTFTQP